MIATDGKGNTRVRGLMQIIIPVTIFLDTIFNDKDGYTPR
jgi:hypothetical protein